MQHKPELIVFWICSKDGNKTQCYIDGRIDQVAWDYLEYEKKVSVGSLKSEVCRSEMTLSKFVMTSQLILSDNH